MSVLAGRDVIPPKSEVDWQEVVAMNASFPIRFLRNLAALFVAIALLPSLPAQAAWNSAAETIENHPVWIYSPSSTMANGKHALLVVLHGCAQSHDEIKNFGNLEQTAENNAIVVAVPSVGSYAWGGPMVKCWDYDGARNELGHIGEIVKLTGNLSARSGLNIDPGHVYVAGLSSGAGLALDLACTAPDVFAGVAALAGPSVGSRQDQASAPGAVISANNVGHALTTCRSLAADKASAFDTQIATIAAGSMDLDGPDQRYRLQLFLTEAEKQAHTGQWAVVSIRWSQDNVQVLQRLYGADALGPAEAVQGDFGQQQLAKKNGKPRISFLVVNNVGHAWPAGTGRPNVPPPDGLWIAQSGLNFPDYIASWLIANNLRAKPSAGPQLTVRAAPQGSKVIASGTAKNRDGSRPNVATVLLKAGSNLQVDNHSGVAVKAGGSFDDTYQNVQDGKYTLQVTARDKAGNIATRVSNEVVVGQPPPPPASRCFTENNYKHVAEERAELCSIGFACAKGSGDNLGLFNVFIVSSVVESPPGFFKKGSCPVP
jgi:poly(3-hydroxybutyrate) depolymerase